MKLNFYQINQNMILTSKLNFHQINQNMTLCQFYFQLFLTALHYFLVFSQILIFCLLLSIPF